MNLSILQKANPSLVNTEPFPYLLIEECLPWKIYNKLDKEFPKNSDAWDKQYDFRTELSPIWQKFIKYHTSLTFYQELKTIFNQHLTTLNFFQDEDLKKLDLYAAPKLAREGGINRNAIEVPHLDTENKFIISNLYFREPIEFEGGNICLYQNLNKIKVSNSPGSPVENLEDIELKVICPYQPNTLVIFLNDGQAVHSVIKTSKENIDRKTFFFLAGKHLRNRLFIPAVY